MPLRPFDASRPGIGHDGLVPACGSSVCSRCTRLSVLARLKDYCWATIPATMVSGWKGEKIRKLACPAGTQSTTANTTPARACATTAASTSADHCPAAAAHDGSTAANTAAGNCAEPAAAASAERNSTGASDAAGAILTLYSYDKAGHPMQEAWQSEAGWVAQLLGSLACRRMIGPEANR